jgi:heptosyltransferase-2
MALRKIVVRAPNWIGDSILAWPALANLKRNYSESQIWVAAHSWVKDLFTMDALYEGIIPLPGKTNLKNLYASAQKLKERDFDLGILLTNSFSSALLFYLARIPHRWGNKKDGRGLFLTRKISVPEQNPVHQVRYYLDLLSGLGLREYTSELILRVPSEIQKQTEARLRSLRIEKKRPLVIINPGAFYGSAKRWPPSKYAELAALLQDKHNAQILIIGSADETRLAESISSLMRESPVIMAGQTTLPQLAGVISFADLFISNDSGPMHLANSLKIPVVALFGPTDPKKTGPYQPPHVLIHKGAPCWPCSYRECPFEHRCMMNISVQETLQACQGFLR